MLPFLAGAGRIVSPMASRALPILKGTAKTVGVGAGVGMGARMLSGGRGNSDNVIPFNSMARANLASTNPGKNIGGLNAQVSAPTANNNGRSTTVNANALGSATENLQEIENVLIDIKSELKEINKNTEEKEVFETNEKSEEQIKSGFSMPNVKGLGGTLGKAGLGLAGFSLLMNQMAKGKENNGEVVPGVPPTKPILDLQSDPNRTGPLDAGSALDSTKLAKAISPTAVRATAAAAPSVLRAVGGVANTVVEKSGKVVELGRNAERLTKAQKTAGFGGKLLKEGVTDPSKLGNLKIIAAKGAALSADLANVTGVTKSGKIAAAVTKAIASKGPGLLGRTIPFVGSAVAAGIGIHKLVKGDMVGAGLAATALVPGVGTVGTLGVAGYEIAREAYFNLHEVYPEEDPKVKERFPALITEASDQVEAFIEKEITARKTQSDNLSSAKDSGLYDEDLIGKSEVDASKIATATTGQLNAIIKDDDISEENQNLINTELEKRAKLTPSTGTPNIDSQEVSRETEAANEARNEPATIIVPPADPAPVNVQASDVSVSVISGDQSLPGAPGSARFVSTV
tara:strand:+ start:76078 stop:77793 length:1716 start_codon:yes stop_codon:yes gene_type:complete